MTNESKYDNQQNNKNRIVPEYLICPQCGAEMYEFQCKYVCPNCGFREDCADH